MVNVLAENGEQQVLCTSPLDTAKYKPDELGELYRIRWGIEEGYKMYKARGQIEAFKRIVKEYNADKNKGLVKHPRKINRAFGYWSTKGILIGMFIKRLGRPWLLLTGRWKPTQKLCSPEDATQDSRNYSHTIT